MLHSKSLDGWTDRQAEYLNNKADISLSRSLGCGAQDIWQHRWGCRLIWEANSVSVLESCHLWKDTGIRMTMMTCRFRAMLFNRIIKMWDPFLPLASYLQINFQEEEKAQLKVRMPVSASRGALQTAAPQHPSTVSPHALGVSAFEWHPLQADSNDYGSYLPSAHSDYCCPYGQALNPGFLYSDSESKAATRLTKITATATTTTTKKPADVMLLATLGESESQVLFPLCKWF